MSLERRRVLWVDPDFDSGRLARFRDVPCNTKVDILVTWPLEAAEEKHV